MRTQRARAPADGAEGRGKMGLLNKEQGMWNDEGRKCLMCNGKKGIMNKE